MLKKLLYILYVAVAIVLATATFVEHINGSPYAHTYIYGAWWFSLLWALLAAVGVIWFVRRRVKKWSVVVLHLSLLTILVGALLTHLSSSQGMVHLRKGETVKTYMKTNEGEEARMVELPFLLKLQKFEVDYHDGTDAAADYETQFHIIDGNSTVEATVSMNNIFNYNGYRFYQTSYDEDMHGSILSLNADPWGIPVTYLGYGLLFFSLIYMLIDPKGTYRKLLRHPALKKNAMIAVLLFAPCGLLTKATAQTTISKENADKFGKMYILYNDRICPLQTYALDFTKKIYGKRSYKDFTAEQVLAGFIFWGDEWCNEPIVKMKGSELKAQLNSDEYRSFNSFFHGGENGYVLGSYVGKYYSGQHAAINKQAVQMDDKLGLIVELRQGSTFKIFPITDKGKTTWLSSVDKEVTVEKTTTDSVKREFIQSAVSLLYQYAITGNDSHFAGVVDDIRKFQMKNGGNSLPRPTAVKAEHLYNKMPFATILFMVNLTLGFVTLFWFIARLARNRKLPHQKVLEHGFYALLAFSFIALTACLVLRWIISGNIPMSNGYETMLLTAWLVMLLSLVSYRKMHIVLTFGFLLSGFFLLVSHIGQMDPQIGRMMPVLNSPLLSIHVSIIMMAYALLSLTFITGIMAMILKGVNKDRHRAEEQLTALQVLSQLFLYPALTCLGLGIFIGAIWANISWGQYWSWDPKETWALITFMVYAVAVHTGTVSPMRRPTVYHAYQIFAFLTILMTYFGVNYLLGGMHSYA